MTWLEIKPNKQVRLYAPSHDADKGGGMCGVLVFRLFAFGFVFVGCARCFFGSFFVFFVCSFLVVVLFFLRVRPSVVFVRALVFVLCCVVGLLWARFFWVVSSSFGFFVFSLVVCWRFVVSVAFLCSFVVLFKSWLRSHP